jgi:hypothetical protein
VTPQRFDLRLSWQPPSRTIGEWWWPGANPLPGPIRATIDPSLPAGVGQAIRAEIDLAISRSRPCRNFLRLLVAAAHRVASAWGYATVEGLIGSQLTIRIEPGEVRIGGGKWISVVRRERNRHLGNRAQALLDSPAVRVRSDATVVVARMGEKVRGAR